MLTANQLTGFGRPVDNTFTFPRESYQGRPFITGLKTITPKITCFKSTGPEPWVMQVSGHLTTSDAGNAYEDLDYTWDFGDPTGLEVVTDHYSGLEIDLNTDQHGPEAAYCYRDNGSYTIMLTVTGKDENGNTISASTTTILRLGEYEIFLGNATGGTYKLTINGQETNAINWDATSDTVITELELLSTVGAGDIITLLSDAATTGATLTDNKFQIVGGTTLVAGAAVTFTMDSSLLTGAGTGDGAPDIIPHFPPSSVSSVTVDDTSSYRQVYFDSNAAAGGDGTIGTPWEVASDIVNEFNDSNATSNTIGWFKANSVFDINQELRLGVGHENIHWRAYGSGDKPIIKNVSGTNTFAELINFQCGFATPATPTQGGYVFEGMAFEGHQTQSGGVMWCFRTENGTNTNQHRQFHGLSLIDCKFERKAGANYLVRQDKHTCMEGFASYRTTYDMGDHDCLTSLGTDVAAWSSVIGGWFNGINGSLIFDHHIYPNCVWNSHYKYISFRRAISANFCINTNAINDTRNEWVCIDGNDLTGTKNGMDFSNINGHYGGIQGHFNAVIISHNKIHAGDTGDGTNENGIISNNLHSVTIRDNWFWSNNQSDIQLNDVNTVPKIYRNRTWQEGATQAWFLWLEQDNGFVFDNRVYKSDTGEFIRFSTDTEDLTTWDFERNHYYGPNKTNFFEDYGAGPSGSFATWQGATYGEPDTVDSYEELFVFNNGPIGDLRMAPIVHDETHWRDETTPQGANAILPENFGDALTSAELISGSTHWEIDGSGNITPSAAGDTANLNAGPYSLTVKFTNAFGTDTATITINIVPEAMKFVTLRRARRRGEIARQEFIPRADRVYRSSRTRDGR